MKNFKYLVTVLSASVLLTFSAAPNIGAKADTVRITDWSTERNMSYVNAPNVVEEEHTVFIYERYLWHSGKTWRATSKRLVPSDFTFNKYISGSNSYSGAGNGSKKYNIRQSIAYDSPVAENSGGNYTVIDNSGKTFSAWSYYTVTTYRYIITDGDGPSIVKTDIYNNMVSYLDSVAGTKPKEMGGASGTQCVELPKHYLDICFGYSTKKLGLGNGNSMYIYIPGRYSKDFEKIAYYDGLVPRVGDIVSLKGSNQYGHAVLVKSVNTSTGEYTILDQWAGASKVRERTVSYIQSDSSKLKIVGIARPRIWSDNQV